MISPVSFLEPDPDPSIAREYIQLATAAGFRVTAFPQSVATGLRPRTVDRYRLTRGSDGGARS